MGYRSRKTACFVLIGSIGVVVVICQQWILSAREDVTVVDVDLELEDKLFKAKLSNVSHGRLLYSSINKTKELTKETVDSNLHFADIQSDGDGSAITDFSYKINDSLVYEAQHKFIEGFTSVKNGSDAQEEKHSDVLEVQLEHRDASKSQFGGLLEDTNDSIGRVIGSVDEDKTTSDKLIVSLSPQSRVPENNSGSMHPLEVSDATIRSAVYFKLPAREQYRNEDSIVEHFQQPSPIVNDGLLSVNDSNHPVISLPAVSANSQSMNNMDADEFAMGGDLSGNKFMQQLPTKSPAAVDKTTMPMSASKANLVNVVSMSLYGSEPRYTFGAIRNAQLIRQNFPGWRLWIYVESPSSSRFAAVSQDVISQLVSLGAELHYITPEDDFIPPMMWRFLVADDPAVDRFIVRDVDSRLTRRDAAAVAAWIKSGRAFHCVRDHPSHAGYALSGGMWGGRAPELRIILRHTWAAMMRGIADAYLDDMNFLNNIVWPRIEHDVYCSDSVSCDHWTGAFPFPIARRAYEHVGQVYDENDIGRRADVHILKDAGENENCVPNHD